MSSRTMTTCCQLREESRPSRMTKIIEDLEDEGGREASVSLIRRRGFGNKSQRVADDERGMEDSDRKRCGEERSG